VAIVGQAPGLSVHQSGIPWNDPSGQRLKLWLGVNDASFYNTENFALIPMGFCYPGKGKSGDLPPSKSCAPLWHDRLFQEMADIKAIILVGNHACRFYLPQLSKYPLTQCVRMHKLIPDPYLVLPHPSPRNNIWLKQNPWFPQEVIPRLRYLIASFGISQA
jgi:uracil-DNA glycosylase